MPKGIENPEKEELRCWGQGSRNREGSSRTSLDSTAIDALLIAFILFHFIFFDIWKKLLNFRGWQFFLLKWNVFNSNKFFLVKLTLSKLN